MKLIICDENFKYYTSTIIGHYGIVRAFNLFPYSAYDITCIFCNIYTCRGEIYCSRCANLATDIKEI
jgi:hypothetical protein